MKASFPKPLLLGMVLMLTPSAWAWDIEYETDNYVYNVNHGYVVRDYSYQDQAVIVPRERLQRYYYYDEFPRVIIRPRVYSHYYNAPETYYYYPAPNRYYEYYDYPRYESRRFYRDGYHAPPYYNGFTFRYYHR